MRSSATTHAPASGRYLVGAAIGAGGTAVVHVGQVLGAAGFSRTVAIKRLHESCARDPEVVAMLLDEARLTSRITHPNVVSTIDVVSDRADDLWIAMEFVHGLTLAQ